MITLIAAAIATTVSAQKKSQEYKGTWVVESTVKTPKEQTIKYYDVSMKLIYEEKVEGKKLNISRQRIQKKLNSRLNELPRDSTALASAKTRD